MPSVATVRICQELWDRAGEVEPFPRTLEPLYTWAIPLAPVPLPALWADDVRRWLETRGLRPSTGPQRRLRACLIARDGRGFVLLDGSDPPDERRFSLAHEAGHFILDYLEPRRRAGTALGPAAVDVLDGARQPTAGERIAAVLNGFALDPHVHLMERDATGLACGSVAGAECAADDLALELLAPEAVVLAMLQAAARGPSYASRELAAAALLERQFGLPKSIAGPYARRLLQLQTGGPSTAEWLGLDTPERAR